MSPGTLYDDDIYAWSEQQAAVLRRLAGSPGRLPNDLDLAHLTEEIEDVGKSQKDAAESFIRLVLVHLLKLATEPGSPAASHWRSEVVTFQIELMAKLTPAMKGRIDMDRLWRLAKRQASAATTEAQALTLPPLSGDTSPLDLAFIGDEAFDVDEALRRLRAL